jgi:hypothetical protein
MARIIDLAMDATITIADGQRITMGSRWRHWPGSQTSFPPPD